MSGGIGTGKSSVLAAIRTALREAGVAVLTRPPRDGDDAAAAVVIDDAQLLDDAELGRLCERVADPAATVVVAAEPLAHHPALRSLATSIERENPVVSLGALSPAEVNRVAAETLGAPPTSEIIRSLMVATAGLPFLLRPTIAAAGSPDGEAPATAIMQAAKFALIERLRRLDEPVLDTLLVSSLSPELGPDDVAAALRVGADQAQALVDHARATGLIEPSHSHTFLRSVHRCIAGIIGTARHHDTEISLLVSQLESSTLSEDLALRLAEHGLHDDRLATELADLASRTRGQPARAARLYRAAADAGATGLSARLADALALTGDCTTAGPAGATNRSVRRRAERGRGPGSPPASPCTHGSGAGGRVPYRPYPDALVSAGLPWRSPRVTRRRPRGAQRGQRRAADVDRTRRTQPRRGSAVVAGSAVPDRRRAAGPFDHHRTAATWRLAGHPRRTGDIGRAARRRPGTRPQRDRQGGARRR